MKKILITTILVSIGLFMSGCGNKNIPNCNDKVVQDLLSEWIIKQVVRPIFSIVGSDNVVDAFKFSYSSVESIKEGEDINYCQATVKIKRDDKLIERNLRKDNVPDVFISNIILHKPEPFTIH